MKTFKFENGDLAIDQSGNIKMVDGKDEVAQSIEMILLAKKGEWFLDSEFGLDYDEMTRKGQSEKGVEYTLREAIFQEERIGGVEFTKIEIDSANRSLTVNFRDDDGEEFEVVM